MTINLTLMTRHIPLLLVLLCAAQLLSARTIQGTVLASNDSTAVAGATCRLLADGKLLSGASTDVNGAFLIETHAKSALNLEISMTGFSPTDVIIKAGAKNLDIGVVYIDRGTTAGEDPSRESPSPCRDGRGEAAIRA